LITAQLTGGLGNQLFTYARLALYANELKIPLEIDGSVVERVLGHTPDLFDFKLLNEARISATDYGALKTQIERVLWRTKYSRKVSKRHQANLLGNQTALPKKSGNWKIRGFYQDFNVATDFIKTFTKNPLTLKSESNALQEYSLKIQDFKTLAIHMRRGDYLNHKESFGVLSDQYYLDAFSELSEKITTERVLIFTDSPDLVDEFRRELPLPTEIVTANDLSTSENLVLMSRCNSLITSNSTFSFWAAILSIHNNVIAPFPWFRSQDNWLISSNLNNPDWNNYKSQWEI
jgi:hypothetical protein